MHKGCGVMKTLISNLSQYIKTYKRFFIQNVVLTIFNSVASVAIPLYFKYYLDRISTNQSASNVAVALIGFFVLLGLSDILSVAWHYFITKLGGVILFDMRRKIMRHIEVCDYEKLTSIGQEKIKNILFNDTLDVFRSAVNFTINLCAKGLILLMIFCIVAVVNIKVFLILLTSFIIGLWIANYSRKKIRKTSLEVNNEFKKASSFLNVYVESIRSVKTNLNYRYYEDYHETLAKSFINRALNNDRVQVSFTKILDNLNYIFSVIVITYLVVVYKSISIGNVVLILYYANLVFGYAYEIESIVSMIGSSMPAFEHINNLLAIEVPYNGIKTIDKIEDVKFTNVKFTYATNTIETLSDLNVSFHKGDVIKLQGTNGSGKTTIIHLLVGLLRPSTGKLFINSASREIYDRNILQKRILYVGQEEMFLNDSINNYYQSLCETPIDKDKILELLKEWDFFEDGNVSNDIITDYKGANLSSGQKRKLLIIKLILMIDNADLILIDELDANLDKQARIKLREMKKHMYSRKDKIFIDITHEIDDGQVNYTRRLLVQDGSIVEQK